MLPQGAIPDLRVQNKHIAIAAVPPGPGRPSSHLVACPRYEGGLRVYALPSLALLHTHELGRGEAGRDSAGEAAAEERPPSSASEAEAEQSDPESVVSDFANDRAVQVTALAADPSGTALIVSDQAGDKAVYAVAWPPPGVPPAAMA